MKLFLWTPILFLSTAGCMSNQGLETESWATNNVYRLWYVEKGMTQAEVRLKMGEPYERASYQLEGDKYDTWFYVTKGTVLGQSRMVPQNLTPLTFLNGSLVGWGYPYYNTIRERYERENPEKNGPCVFLWPPLEECLAMSKKEEPPKEEGSEDDQEDSEETQDSQKKRRFDKRDDKMLEEEQEQDFDYW